jgi:putative lipase involved disintegration of autophagic bodies
MAVDKQDNLMFSCCCARVDFSWSTVCDCYAGGYKCGQSCVETALVEESVYAAVGTSLYNNVTYLYPDANIWLVGHSVSCAISSRQPRLTIKAGWFARSPHRAVLWRPRRRL